MAINVGAKKQKQSSDDIEDLEASTLYELAKLSYTGEYAEKFAQNFEESLILAEASVKKGCAKSHNILGNIYFHGKIAKPDFGKAAFHFEEAAKDQDNALALYNLALMYLDGKHFQQSDETACTYFMEASEKGLKDAYTVLRDNPEINKHKFDIEKKNKLNQEAEKVQEEQQTERRPDMDDGPNIEKPDLTIRGTLRKYRPKRSKEEMATGPKKVGVKLGGQVAPELRDSFAKCVTAQGTTQSAVLEDFVIRYLEEHGCHNN